MKNISFLSENFQFFLEVKFSIYLNRYVFVMLKVMLMICHESDIKTAYEHTQCKKECNK